MPHGTDSLLLQMFTIFVWAKVFGELFERMHLPAVLGEILAGVILGPYATRFILPGDTIYSIAEIGAVFLLFTVGLETAPSDLIRVGRISLGVAIAGIVLPFAMGFIFMRVNQEPMHEAVFVAAAMVATSVGITARVLRDLNVHKSRPAQIILGAAVFDDILGMLLLGVLVSTVTTGGVQWLHLSLVSVEAIGFAIFMIYVAPRVVDRLEPGIEQMQTQDAPLVLALALCLGLSVAATRIGMAAIIGAFFAGIAFADYSPRWNLEPRAQAINQFLSPFFFFTMGSRLDLSVFSRSVVAAGTGTLGAGGGFQDHRLRPAPVSRGLAQNVAGRSRNDAARRGGADRRADRFADEHDLATRLRPGHRHDRGDHDPAGSISADAVCAGRSCPGSEEPDEVQISGQLS